VTISAAFPPKAARPVVHGFISKTKIHSPKFTEIEQFPAELLRFRCFKFRCCTPSWIWP